MSTYKFANNAESELVSDLGASDTVLYITSGDGALFPAAGGGDQFYVLAEQGSVSEWMLCTSRTGDALTVTRSGSPQSFAAGASVRLRVNATIFDSFLQKGVYRTNAGSPDGVLAAEYSGEEVLDSTNNEWYKHCTGTTWKKMAGS